MAAAPPNPGESSSASPSADSANVESTVQLCRKLLDDFNKRYNDPTLEPHPAIAATRQVVRIIYETFQRVRVESKQVETERAALGKEQQVFHAEREAERQKLADDGQKLDDERAAVRTERREFHREREAERQNLAEERQRLDDERQRLSNERAALDTARTHAQTLDAQSTSRQPQFSFGGFPPQPSGPPRVDYSSGMFSTGYTFGDTDTTSHHEDLAPLSPDKAPDTFGTASSQGLFPPASTNPNLTIRQVPQALGTAPASHGGLSTWHPRKPASLNLHNDPASISSRSPQGLQTPTAAGRALRSAASTSSLRAGEKRGVAEVSGGASKRPGSTNPVPGNPAEKAPGNPSTVTSTAYNDTAATTIRKRSKGHPGEQDPAAPTSKTRAKAKKPARSRKSADSEGLIPSDDDLFGEMDIWDPVGNSRLPAISLSPGLKTIMLGAGLEKFRQEKRHFLLQKPQAGNCAHLVAAKTKSAMSAGRETCKPCLDKHRACITIQQNTRPLIVPLPADIRGFRSRDDAAFWINP